MLMLSNSFTLNDTDHVNPVVTLLANKYQSLQAAKNLEDEELLSSGGLIEVKSMASLTDEQGLCIYKVLQVWQEKGCLYEDQ